ncbi:MAG: eukaryotic-like serine/threonine-protein kinase [Blastocatellia bacterium]|jgi:serine/threonine-protein kinase|nr:eukaryotic-like serine/threonine-protein kinase [Blastocatellia bacterium]
MIAESIAHYRIIKKLGAGGMGEVYLALDTKLDRKVAIKVLQPDSLGEENLKKRLIREAQAAAKLDHPNICAVHDVNEANSLTFIVMQYIEGETLAEKMERQPLQISTALAIAEHAAEALVEAHRHGIVHRDLKPQNMMITPRGQLKILDFGLAKQIRSGDSVDFEGQTSTLLSSPGNIVGTMPYMSPEQLQGEPLDGRSDIFSFGVILYEMLAGKHPFQDKSAAVTLSRIMLGDPIPTEQFQARVSPELQALLNKMLSKDRTARYQNAEELLADLRQLPAKSSANEAGADSTATKHFPAITSTETVASRVLSKARQHKWVVLAAVLALALLAFGISRWLMTEHLDSLAILPFSYVSSNPQLMANPDREYLSDGLTESIINNLSQLTDLKVIARSSVFRYKGINRDVQAIGRELNVRAVLVGGITQEGDELTINVELMDVQANRSIWGTTYQRKTDDIQAVQKEIAKTVSEKLRLKLTGADQTQLAKSYTENGAAYEAYLKGRYHWNKRTEEGFKKARDFFQEAIVKDPKYALAFSGLADCYTLQSDYGFLEPKEGYALAKGAAVLALSYDESLAEAHTSLASTKAVTDWDWQGAENEYRRAIELNPKYATAHHWFAAQLLLQGRLDQALQEIKKAQQLDPLSLGINKDYAVILLYARDYDNALEQCRKTLEIEPGFGAISTYIAQIYELKQKFPEATAELEKAHAAAPNDSEITYALGQAYALMGRKDEALKISDEVNQPAKQKVALPKEGAYLYALLGDKERAIALLQKAAEDHYLPVAEVKMDPRFAELRKDARVIEILQKIGLAQ